MNIGNDLAMLSFSEIPNAKEDAREITALIKEEGTVIGYKLSDGTNVTKEEAISLAKSGDIAHVGVSTNKGNEYLKSLPDGSEANNLSSLPTVDS